MNATGILKKIWKWFTKMLAAIGRMYEEVPQ